MSKLYLLPSTGWHVASFKIDGIKKWPVQGNNNNNNNNNNR